MCGEKKMNKVSERCREESSAKFHYGSKKMFFEVKTIKVVLYFLAIIPIALTFVPISDDTEFANTFAFICSIVSFSLTLINELTSAFLDEHKEKAILLHQVYESEITGSTFSKMEYDREFTNELQELAIRKGAAGITRAQQKNRIHIVTVPEKINDDYSYIYLSRKSAANNRFLLSRIFYFYFFILMLIVGLFVGAMFLKTNVFEYLTLLIGFYPLINPIIKDCTACKKTMKTCAKICADIDNFFADGDASIERLARFYYYVQNIEFEMMKDRPAVFSIFPKMFKRGTRILDNGVTKRFIEAIEELQLKSLILKDTISTNTGKSIITKSNLSLEDLKKAKEEKKKKEIKREIAKQKKKEETTSKLTTDTTPKTTKSTTKKSSSTKDSEATGKKKTTVTQTSKSTTPKKSK